MNIPVLPLYPPPTFVEMCGNTRVCPDLDIVYRATVAVKATFLEDSAKIQTLNFHPKGRTIDYVTYYKLIGKSHKIHNI